MESQFDTRSTQSSPTIFIRIQRKPMRIALLMLLALLCVAHSQPVAAAAPSDPVLEWNAIMNDTVIGANSSPLVSSRVVALVSASVFDAVNGVRTRYQPLYVPPAAPKHASQRAAAVQAAYAILINLYPAQAGSLTTKHDASIAAIALQENAKSIQAGITWGQAVADSIWAWRLTDGIAPAPPPFLGVLGIETTPAAVGAWRPTPLANASGAGPQFATMTPWVLLRPSQFRLPPPFALTSPEYAADYNELKTMGSFLGSSRSADQSELALFWAGNTPLYWNRIASQIASERSLSLSQNAHLFALLNVSMADAVIACWDGKYRYVFWRPITAIRAGDTERNPASDPNSTFGHRARLLSGVRPGTREIPQFLVCDGGNRRRASLWRYSLQDLLPAGKYAWTSGCRLYFDPRHGRFGGRLSGRIRGTFDRGLNQRVREDGIVPGENG